MQKQQQRPRSEGRLMSPSPTRQRFVQEHRRTSDMNSSMDDEANSNDSTSPNSRRPRTTPVSICCYIYLS
jgi:hypothetical protein